MRVLKPKPRIFVTLQYKFCVQMIWELTMTWAQVARGMKFWTYGGFGYRRETFDMQSSPGRIIVLRVFEQIQISRWAHQNQMVTCRVRRRHRSGAERKVRKRSGWKSRMEMCRALRTPDLAPHPRPQRAPSFTGRSGTTDLRRHSASGKVLAKTPSRQSIGSKYIVGILYVV